MILSKAIIARLRTKRKKGGTLQIGVARKLRWYIELFTSVKMLDSYVVFRSQQPSLPLAGSHRFSLSILHEGMNI
jgi:hypothetical protein